MYVWFILYSMYASLCKKYKSYNLSQALEQLTVFLMGLNPHLLSEKTFTLIFQPDSGHCNQQGKWNLLVIHSVFLTIMDVCELD